MDAGADDSDGAWVLLSVSTGKDASLRVFVWRHLRRLGALYLHQSVCLLPDRPSVREALAPVLARVRGQGGQARELAVRVQAEEHRALVEEQRRERDAEYAEVLERAPQLLAELAMETERGRATYAEVEESEADLERFERWLGAIAARDYFEAPGAIDAHAALQRCRSALAAFEAAAVAADTGQADETGEADPRALTSDRPLRAVDGRS